MKKLFTLGFLGLFALAVSAQKVTLRFNGNDQDVKIDGIHNYSNSTTITELKQGSHFVQVYGISGGGILGIGKKRTLLSSSRFDLRNEDIIIDIDQNGKLTINNANSVNNDRNGSVYDRKQDDGNVYDNRNDDGTNVKKKNGKGYGPYNNPGKGHKYGLYKNKDKKDKKEKKYKDKDERDDR